ncbi:amidohydrolase [Ginsengibacter hankyongi]|uniref:Amidohydrolase n=1 Tax=Ginsengibacter hankyongi TaxID=2607284 RepID=A0A5J5IIP9_9BACT|nr:M20 family metallopeptidase [Ginsengibacter hankyongi]KAA9039212.1 amidohydrolase [Ginsengibacter hankyongi]
MIQDKIKQLASKYANEFIDVRHYLHAHPELSFSEFETSEFVQEKLKSWGIEYKVMATTGVVGIIKGKNPNEKVIALRADMDALPIKELNDVEYRSKKIGVMHACGHDVHTTCLLGAAKILNELNEEWSGTIKLIFQPGEEKNPGGASILIKEGVLENPAPQAIFALHVNPSLPVGKLSFRSGMVMASADEIYITIKGKGGHAAAPHLTADTILVASQLVVNLQQVVSRKNDPFNPCVLSITSIQGGNTTNVIPAEVKLIGTFRAMNEEWRFKAHELIKNICKNTAEMGGAEIDVHIDVGYPFVINNEQLTMTAKRNAIAFAGIENVEETEMRMGAEDFAFYSHKIPACFFRLGVGNIEKKITSGVHTPTFNIDEAAIENGIGIMAWLAASASIT